MLVYQRVYLVIDIVFIYLVGGDWNIWIIFNHIRECHHPN